MLSVVRSGKEIEGEPAIMTALADAGVWDQTAVVAMIRSGHFDRVVLESVVPQMFTPEIRAAIEETYTNVQQVGTYQLREKP